jgi:hypothetical protein
MFENEHQQLGNLVSMGFSTKETRKNQKKPKKTQKHGNLETHVRFSGNLPAGSRKLSLDKSIPDLTLY